LCFDQLFGAAMQQANVRIDALDKLAIELQNQAQHAVGRGVNRAEVDREIADVVRLRPHQFFAFSSPGST
jgi:hypothetical protein